MSNGLFDRSAPRIAPPASRFRNCLATRRYPTSQNRNHIHGN